MMPTRIWIAGIVLMGWFSVMAATQTPPTPSSPAPTPTAAPDPATVPLMAKEKEPERSLIGVSPSEGLPQGLSSQQVAALFARLAYERYRAPDASAEQIFRAWVLYRAALALDPRSPIQEDLIRVATSIPDQDLSGEVQWAYHNYASDPDLDLEVAMRAVRYLRDRLQESDSWIWKYTTRLMKTSAVIDRDLRLRLFIKLREIAETRNPVLTADLLVQEAEIIREQTNFQGVAQRAMAAQDLDPFQLGVIPLIQKDPEVYCYYLDGQLERILARQKIDKNKLDDAQKRKALGRVEILAFLRFWRIALQISPMDPDAAEQFARFTENQRLYDLAAAGYEYAAALAEYGSGPDPNWDRTLIQIHYRDPSGREICLQIADRIRRSGRFDLMVEELAVRAAEHLGRMDQARSLLDQTQQRIDQLLAKDPNSPMVSPPMLAGYYAFVDPHPEKALAWANKARAEFPQSPQVMSLFGYALSMSTDPNLAREYVEKLSGQDSIAALTLGKLSLAQGDKETAIRLFRQAVAIDSFLLASEQADKLLADMGFAPAPTLNPEDRKIMEDQFAQSLAPSFIPPSKRISVKFGGNNLNLPFGRPMNIYLSIQNISKDPVLIRDAGLLKGRIRVDAFVRGDLKQDLPGLIETRIQPAASIAPGKSLLIPLRIDTGSLNQLLWTHPQANLDIELVAYLDPVPDESNGVRNTYPDLPEVRIALKRPGMPLSRPILMDRLDSISKGPIATKIKASREVAGLWMEQVEKTRSGISYRHNQVDPVIYLDALRRCLSGEDWVVAAETLSVLDAMPDPVPYEMIQAVSPLLQNPNWPVRMMALLVLSRSGPGQFQKVLDWVVASDNHPLVKDLAVSLGGKQPQPPAGSTPESSPVTPTESDKVPENSGK